MHYSGRPGPAACVTVQSRLIVSNKVGKQNAKPKAVADPLAQTHYNGPELQEWYNGLLKGGPDGTLTRPPWSALPFTAGLAVGTSIHAAFQRVGHP